MKFQTQLDVDLGDPYLPSVQYTGQGDLPSRYAVSDLAAETFARASAWLARYRDGPDAIHASLSVDRVLASRWFDWSLRPDGWETPAAWDSIAGDYLCADGWVRLHTNAPVHRQAAIKALQLHEGVDRLQVAAAVKTWTAEAIELAVVAVGGCAARLHSPSQWADHPQGRAVALQSLVHHEEFPLGAVAAHHLPDSSHPLMGLKVLDLTRVLAGPVAGRFLAGYGAKVLRIDPPGWEEAAVVPEVTLGKRCAGLDLHNQADRDIFTELLRQSDVLLHGYRPSALENLGFGDQWRREQNSALIDVSLSAYGHSGPWAQRRGYDSLMQMSTGIAFVDEPSAKPKPLPVQALDHGTGYLMAAAVLRGLTKRRELGIAYRSRLSLARTAALLVSEKPSQPMQPWPDESPEDCSQELELTDWGAAQRLRFPVSLEQANCSWSIPAGELRRHKPSWSFENT